MKSYAIKATLLGLLLALSGISYAEENVVEITVEGNKYIETPAVLAKIRSKVGEPLNRRQISRDVRKLFATGYFSDVYTEGEKVKTGIKLSFVVVENPVIANVRIEGNEEIADKKLRPIMKMKPGLILSPKVERQDSNAILKDYHKKGYYQATLKIESTMLDDGRVDVEVNIAEGNITFIKEIRFIGNKAFSDSELIEPLASRASDFSSWFSSRDVYNQQRFEADAQFLQQFYQDHGYLDARIESVRLMLSPEKDGFYLALSIYEGPQFTVGGVGFQGDIVPSREALLEKVALKKGDLYAVTKLRRSIADITERVGDEGFAFASVTPLLHRNIENNTVVIDFDIEKGREVYVERIEISGHKKTKDYVIRRELRQHEGERYSASKIRRGKERLNRLGYIKDVRFSTSKGTSADLLKGKIDLEEGKSGTFSAGFTYSQLNDFAFTGKVEEQNLFGEGYRTNISADVGGATNNYAINFIDPYFLDEDISASVNVFRSESDMQSTLQYNQKSEGGSVGLSFALNEYTRYSVAYSQTKSSLSGVPVTSSLALRLQEGTFSTGELKQTLSYDTRNRVFSPSEGSLNAISFGYAGLTGDHDFYELGFASKNYFPLTDFWTFRAAMNAGAIRGYSNNDAPVFRKYSLGGVGSLRGYDIFGVSLVDPASLDILGGEYKATASLDLIFPLPYMEAAGFKGAFFIDGGTVWGNSGLVSEALDANKIRGSYGFGIEWTSPIGPITMTWARAANEQANDKTRTFEFALGRGF